MLYFQVASVILAYGSRRADWCSSTFGSPQNNFGGYHIIIVAQRGRNCNPFNETSLLGASGKISHLLIFGRIPKSVFFPLSFGVKCNRRYQKRVILRGGSKKGILELPKRRIFGSSETDNQI